MMEIHDQLQAVRGHVVSGCQRRPLKLGKTLLTPPKPNWKSTVSWPNKRTELRVHTPATAGVVKPMDANAFGYLASLPGSAGIRSQKKKKEKEKKKTKKKRERERLVAGQQPPVRAGSTIPGQHGYRDVADAQCPQGVGLADARARCWGSETGNG